MVLPSIFYAYISQKLHEQTQQDEHSHSKSSQARNLPHHQRCCRQKARSARRAEEGVSAAAEPAADSGHRPHLRPWARRWGQRRFAAHQGLPGQVGNAVLHDVGSGEAVGSRAGLGKPGAVEGSGQDVEGLQTAVVDRTVVGPGTGVAAGTEAAENRDRLEVGRSLTRVDGR
jgi:hypothetical protein